MRRPPRGVSIVEICPPDDFKPTRLGRNKNVLNQGYRQGRGMAAVAMGLWENHGTG